MFVLERPENSSDLFDYIDRRDFLTEDEGRQLFTNILDAAIECEKQGVIHRDIKPENIIIDLSKMEAKLTDFGLACDSRDAPFRCFVGKRRSTNNLIMEMLFTGLSTEASPKQSYATYYYLSSSCP